MCPSIHTTDERPNPFASTTPTLDFCFYFVVLFLAWDLKTLPSNPCRDFWEWSSLLTLEGVSCTALLNCRINAWVFLPISGRLIIMASYKQNPKN